MIRTDTICKVSVTAGATFTTFTQNKMNIDVQIHEFPKMGQPVFAFLDSTYRGVITKSSLRTISR